ncbi:hypothetical protein BG011_008567 [Mortierella polycephala]|uniref:Heparan-alpha-glucosaminide N-acetyltransferase catalytic domain-containing protein n=1 Tax=Mortierella polycephala TaxID=41804 RepID=A0A9P6PQA4_9FUNG|nr:hypothetical protein BG011_008567 [Mortierella polycephala]
MDPLQTHARTFDPDNYLAHHTHERTNQTAAAYLTPRPTASNSHNQHAKSLASLGPDLNAEFEIKLIGNRADGHNSSGSNSNTMRKRDGEQGLGLVDHAGTSARGSLEPQPSSAPGAATKELPVPSKPKRFLSLDTLRGITIIFMVLVNIQGADPFEQLGHSDRFGYTLADRVFPNFIFMVRTAVAIILLPIKLHAMTQSGSTF